MKRSLFRLSTAVLTFAFGVILASALLKTSARLPEPHEPPVKEKTADKTLEMVFVLDTTGSMGGLIDGAKQRIWGIVNEVMQTPAQAQRPRRPRRLPRQR